MEIHESDIYGFILVFIGLSFLCTGKIQFKFGVTDGSERSNFLLSRRGVIQGKIARLVGFILIVTGISFVHYSQFGELLFVL